MNRKVELLAPAGNYQAFLGAVNAGADAVYLGGEKFGARAYADNFTAEEICRAIHTAHFLGRKVYLTVNTLIKDQEFAELYDYLLPFYEIGLDGVIVQDLGVLCYIRDHFQGLALHASTQMTLTGPRGAEFMKTQGVERIVPARELSLKEVRRIKEQTGLEIECFIHGAMCYCYSGQCLFSSMLGGRSGNRGRCAQPCRLPYQIYENSEEIKGIEYPLSLKDMCTVSYIPQLVEAGIDSFKIEGRMKKPEYAAGVTAIYRKYIDLYEQTGSENYRIEKRDLNTLRSLYIRSEVQTGYYERHNGREMVTLHKPSYAGSDKALLEQVSAAYLREPDKQPVEMRIVLKTGEPVCLHLVGRYSTKAEYGSIMSDSKEDKAEQEIRVTVLGDIVEKARKMPLQKDNIIKQLSKTGNSCVYVSKCNIEMQDDIFLPVSSLNELRRKAIDTYEKRYIKHRGLAGDRDLAAMDRLSPQISADFDRAFPEIYIDILVSTYDQFTVAVCRSCRRIYIDSDLFLAQNEKVTACMTANSDREYYLALPYVLRERDEGYLQQLTRLLESKYCEENTDRISMENPEQARNLIKGFLIRNLEEAAYVAELGESYKMIPDAGLYSFNEAGVRFWAQYTEEYTLPYELNKREAEQLVRYAAGIGMRSAMIVYSRIPMMITANCVRKTAGRCRMSVRTGRAQGNESAAMWLKDRYEKAFPVETNCIHCYNIIYNSVPYSLHLKEHEITRIGARVRRYDFTMESAEECRRILAGGDFPYETYTTGHLKRGVE